MLARAFRVEVAAVGAVGHGSPHPRLGPFRIAIARTVCLRVSTWQWTLVAWVLRARIFAVWEAVAAACAAAVFRAVARAVALAVAAAVAFACADAVAFACADAVAFAWADAVARAVAEAVAWAFACALAFAAAPQCCVPFDFAVLAGTRFFDGGFAFFGGAAFTRFGDEFLVVAPLRVATCTASLATWTFLVAAFAARLVMVAPHDTATP